MLATFISLEQNPALILTPMWRGHMQELSKIDLGLNTGSVLTWAS